MAIFVSGTVAVLIKPRPDPDVLNRIQTIEKAVIMGVVTTEIASPGEEVKKAEVTDNARW